MFHSGVIEAESRCLNNGRSQLTLVKKKKKKKKKKGGGGRANKKKQGGGDCAQKHTRLGQRCNTNRLMRKNSFTTEVWGMTTTGSKDLRQMSKHNV